MIYAIAGAVVCVMTTAGGFILIPLLKQLKFGQTVRDDGPRTHLNKTGTPTMGGILFLLPILLAGGFFAFSGYPELLPVLFITIGYGIVGFTDDYLKIWRKSKDGLRPRQKMAGLLLVAVLFAALVRWGTDTGTAVMIPFLYPAGRLLDLSWAFIPLTVFLAVWMGNAVNLTDGLDGLVSGIVMLISLLLLAVAMFLGGMGGLGMQAAMLAGGCLGFLFFNRHPARVFMGDVGSLALGGALAGTAVMMRHPLLLILPGIVLIAETLSVMIQVFWYKRTKRRVFRMAPLHHHFELGGWPETWVVLVFWAVTALGCLAAWFSVAGFGIGPGGI